MVAVPSPAKCATSSPRLDPLPIVIGQFVVLVVVANDDDASTSIAIGSAVTAVAKRKLVGAMTVVLAGGVLPVQPSR